METQQQPKAEQQPKNDPTPKKAKAIKTKAIQKPAADLVLTSTIHIPAVQKYADGKSHFTTGQHYPAGTVVTEDMLENYEIARKLIGGETPITKFCE